MTKDAKKKAEPKKTAKAAPRASSVKELVLEHLLEAKSLLLAQEALTGRTPAKVKYALKAVTAAIKAASRI